MNDIVRDLYEEEKEKLEDLRKDYLALEERWHIRDQLKAKLIFDRKGNITVRFKDDVEKQREIRIHSKTLIDELVQKISSELWEKERFLENLKQSDCCCDNCVYLGCSRRILGINHECDFANGRYFKMSDVAKEEIAKRY